MSDTKVVYKNSGGGIGCVGFIGAMFLSYAFHSSVWYAILCAFGNWIYILYNLVFYFKDVKAAIGF